MKKILPLIIFFSVYFKSNGQTPVGSWSDHLIYNSANCVAAGGDEIYASTGYSLLIYNKTFAELKKMSGINGLSETGISTLGWSDQDRTLIIGYKSTNVDLLKNNTVFNIPDISRKFIDGTKTINKIRTAGKYAYLACSFGIVVIDLDKKEIYDTWKPGVDDQNNGIHDLAFGNGKIYAATDRGVFSADPSIQGLSYFANWDLITTLPNSSGKYTAIVYSGNKLYVNLSDPVNGDQVWSLNGTASLLSQQPGIINRALDKTSDGFLISSPSMLRYFNNDGNLLRSATSYGWALPDIFQAIGDNNDIWIADKHSGLILWKNTEDFSAYTLPGPVSNDAFYITSANGKTIISGGATDDAWNNLGRLLQISSFENNEWTNITSASILDPVRVIADPLKPSHIFVSSWGNGLLEYENSILINHYTETNSPLQSSLPGRPYIRIAGLAFDVSGDLWITQSEVPGGIKVLKPDGSWIVNPVSIDAQERGDIIITKKGQKWIILPQGHGLFVLDDNNTPDVFTDDSYKRILVQDTENQTISSVFSIAEDLDGNVWIGTDQGPMIYFNTEKVFESDLKASRIKIPRNDGSNLADYMLKTEKITSIAIDGGNRKWLGTAGSGAYLLSVDGTKQIRNYNEQNSPVLSDSINSLAVDNKTGDVWFATVKGVQSLRGDATEGTNKFTKVYTFPNPVREYFYGNVTITGLMKDSQIRITDISGNLVYETVSEGGTATWDLTTYNGKRVSTGVYLVFCASKDGTQSIVTKMLVIK